MIKKEITKIPLKDIVVPEGHRSIHDLEKFSSSIKAVGQINPIIVKIVDKERKYELVAGFHRLMGHAKAGLEEIEAVVVEGDDLDIELIKIDENLTRNELTTLEKFEYIKRKTEILEAKNGSRAKTGRPVKGDTVAPFTTTKSMADDIGYSERTVQRACQVVQNVHPKAKENIKGTEVADSTRELLELARLNPEKQVEVTQPIKEGKCKTIKEAKIAISHEEKERIFRNAPFPHNDDVQLFLGDYKKQNIKENSIDLIPSDIDYLGENEAEWQQISRFAAKVLKPGSFFITYVGNYSLDKIIFALSVHLQYFWQYACIHQGGHSFVHQRGAFAGWKPILVFRKGSGNPPNGSFYDVLQVGKREKNLHKWQQAEAEAEKLIKDFSKTGDLVLDPFVGSGTNAVAAIKQKRKFIGIDIAPECIKTTELRIKELCAELENKEPE